MLLGDGGSPVRRRPQSPAWMEDTCWAGLEGLGNPWGRLAQWQILVEYRLGSHRRFWSEGWGWQSPGTEWIFREADDPSGWLQPGPGKAPWTYWLHQYWALICFSECQQLRPRACVEPGEPLTFPICSLAEIHLSAKQASGSQPS
jgi:hypothetical protein